MANRLEAAILIHRPIEDIFTFINHPDNHPKFVPGMLEFKKGSPGPIERVGTVIRGVRRFLGRRIELPYEITEYQPCTRLGMRGAMGPLTFMDGYVLESMGPHTRVKFWLEPTLTGVMKLARPFIALVGRTHAHETLTNLKKALEPQREAARMAIDLYQPFTNPITKETFRCLSCTEEAYVMEWIVQPQGYVPFEHIHLAQDEIFHVMEGEIRVVVNRQEQLGRAGQTVIAPRGARHIAYNNAPDEALVCIVEYKPGLDISKSFQCFSGLTCDGDVHGKYGINIPKMMYFMKRMNMKALARPSMLPGPIFDALMNLFYVYGALVGWEKLYKKYTE